MQDIQNSKAVKLILKPSFSLFPSVPRGFAVHLSIYVNGLKCITLVLRKVKYSTIKRGVCFECDLCFCFSCFNLFFASLSSVFLKFFPTMLLAFNRQIYCLNYKGRCPACTLYMTPSFR